MNHYSVEHISFLSVNKINTISGVIYVPDSKPKGILQISHGMCEYIDRYDRFMSFLANKGYIVAGHDHLGHGQSSEEAEYGYFGAKDGYKNLVEDLHHMTLLVKAKYGNLPYVLLGHSMGSFIARLYLSDYSSELDGAIICGTGGPVPMSSEGIKLANFLCKKKGDFYRSSKLDRMLFGSFNDRIKPKRTPKDWLTRDASIVDKYLQDPKCMFTFTAAGFRDLMTLSTKVNISRWYESLSVELPVLLISGDMDPVGNYGKGVTKVYERLKKTGLKDVSMILYPGARHEILNELNFQEVYTDIENWIQGLNALNITSTSN